MGEKLLSEDLGELADELRRDSVMFMAVRARELERKVRQVELSLIRGDGCLDYADETVSGSSAEYVIALFWDYLRTEDAAYDAAKGATDGE